MRKFIFSFSLLIFATSAFSENIVQLSCELSIEKKFSEGGDSRRYYNNSVVKVLNESSKKLVEINGPNFSLYLDASENYIYNKIARFTDDQWVIDWSSKSYNGRILINRLTGDLYAESLSEDSSGWMKTVVSGPCRKIDHSSRRF
jgi:hypothetical protein